MSEYLKLFKEIGTTPEAIEQRFAGHSALYIKYLCAFETDPSYAQLCTAMREGDAQKAFAAAHTLKGVCATFLLNRLLEPCLRILEIVRQGETEAAQAFMPELHAQYEHTIAAIAKFR